jgi:hypothetical protein
MEVLEKALVLENGINDLTRLYLGIEKEDRRAIGHKSGTLTYKNLLDLLYDIDVLDKHEYLLLLRLMEIRNQFMHNLACDTFEKAVGFLGTDRGKLLLKHDDIGGETLERRYSNGFLGLSIQCIRIIHTKLGNKRRDVQEKSAYIRGLLDFIAEYEETVHARLDTFLDHLDPDNDTEADQRLEMQILKLLMTSIIIEHKQELIDKYGAFTTALAAESPEMAKRLLR